MCERFRSTSELAILFSLISIISASTSLASLFQPIELVCALWASAVSARIMLRGIRSEYTNQIDVYLCDGRSQRTHHVRFSAFYMINGSKKNLPIERWHRTMVHNETTWQLIRFVDLRLLLGYTTNAFDYYRLKSWMPVIAFEIIRTTCRPAKLNCVFLFFSSLLTSVATSSSNFTNCGSYDCFVSVWNLSLTNYLKKKMEKKKMC